MTRGSRWLARVAPVVAVVGFAGIPGGPSHAQAPAADLFDPAVVRDFHLSFHDADWETRLAQVGETGFVYADLVVDGQAYRDVGVRLKGNSSSRGPGRKKPLNLTLDARVDGQDLMGFDTVNLNNGFADPTLARETLTTDTLRPFQPMPRTAYVRAHINGAYFGLYTLVEQIEGRFIRAWFPFGDGILFKGDPVEGAPVGPPGGPPTATPARPARSAPPARHDRPAPPGPPDLSGSRDQSGPADQPGQSNQPDQPGQPGRGGRPDLRWLGEDLAAYRRAYELKTDGAGDAAYTRLRELIRVLDAPVAEGGVSDADFPAAIARVLDVDGALWYLAALNLYTNYDSYYAGHNYFLYRSDADGRFHILSWDVNESFGVFPGAGISPGDRQAVARTDPFLMATGAQAAARPLVRRLLAVPRFRADYLAHYRTLLAEAFGIADLTARVEAYQARIAPSVASDPNRLYALDLFARNVWEDVDIGRPVPALLGVARDRAAWLAGRDDMQAPDIRLAEQVADPEAPAAGEPVRLAMRFEGAQWPTELDLIYRVDGGPPTTVPFMPGDVTFFATIPAQPAHAVVAYHVRAVVADGRVAFFPSANLTRPWTYTVRGAVLPVEPGGDLVINEILADNATAGPDPAGEFDDWVELHNRGPQPIALADYYLSDDPEDALAFRLPDVPLAPGAFMLIWCDEDAGQGPDHAGFKLSKSGETVLLSTARATVDRVAFGPQTTDVSWGRDPDGGDAWSACAPPSPRAANRCGGAVTPAASATATHVPTSPPTATHIATATPTGAPSTPPGGGTRRVFLPLMHRP